MSAVTQTSCTPYFRMKRQSFAAASSTWSVPDLCHAYKWPTALEGGGVIAIVELDGGWVQNDMTAYFHSIGQPLPSIVDVSVDGTVNNPNQHLGDPRDPDFEVALDIQIAAAAYFTATGRPATIRVYWAKDIAPAVDRARADGCDVCSISWGADEALWGAAEAGKMELAAKAAVDAGMIVLAASGDNDSGDGGSNPANVDLPAACTHVIGCGGTRKTKTHETVWNNNPGNTHGEGTGGGFSTFFPRPAFQNSAPPSPHGKGRMVPDVSANADPNTGYIIYVHGESISGEGGTSAVAPLYAGLFASFGRKLGFITPKLWSKPNLFFDVVQGDNGFYEAAPGADPCTGLGSPIGVNIAALFGHAAAHAAAS